MSMSGSLMGYENNNEVGQAKCKKSLKAAPVATSVNAAGVTSTTGHGSCNGRGHAGRPRSFRSSSGHRRKRKHVHVNGLWSVWYGIIAVAFQAYIATRCTKRFIGELYSIVLENQLAST